MYVIDTYMYGLLDSALFEKLEQILPLESM